MDGSGGRRLVDRPLGPLLLALGFAVLSLPITTVGLLGVVAIEPGDTTPPDWQPALAGAVGAVLAGGLAGGLLAGRLLRSRPLAGCAVALSVAWPAAIAALPVVPWLVGLPFGLRDLCTEGCGQPVRFAAGIAPAAFVDHLVWLVSLYAISVILASVVAWPLLLIALAAAARSSSRPRWSRPAIGLVLASWAALNVFSIQVAPLPALVLFVGATLWSVVIVRAGRRRQRPPDRARVRLPDAPLTRPSG